MVGSFLIFLREGIEGSMIVTIMLTYLAAAGRRDLFRPIFLGVGAALLAAAAFGTALYLLVKSSFVNSIGQTWFETASFLIAVVVLTYMTFWMKRNARNMGKDLKTQMAVASGGSAFALAMVAFATVGREAIETSIFLLAIAFQNSPMALLVGAVAGLAVSFALSQGMYRLGIRVNMKHFFTAVGAALMVVAAGLLANAAQNLQQLGVLPGAHQTLWNTSAFIPDESAVGDILHGLLGYAASPTVLQFTAWILFLAVGLTLFLGIPARVFRRPNRPIASH